MVTLYYVRLCAFFFLFVVTVTVDVDVVLLMLLLFLRCVSVKNVLYWMARHACRLMFGYVFNAFGTGVFCMMFGVISGRVRIVQ